MKKLKTFENFMNSKSGESLIKEYDKHTLPSEPYKRSLTDEENRVMLKNFQNHSWSTNIDSNGHIILGGGEGEGGYYYITEDDLNSLV